MKERASKDPASQLGHREETVLRYARQMTSLSDPAEVARGRAALEALFRKEQSRIYAICLKFLRNPEWAEDAAQDVMLIAFNKLPEFKGESTLRTWLYGIARYRCYDLKRKKREVLNDDGLNEIMDDDPGALKSMRRRERGQLMQEAIKAALDPLEQRAVHLRYVELMSQDDIAEVLGLETASGGRGLLQRCRRKLNRELRRRLEEMGHGTSFVRTSV